MIVLLLILLSRHFLLDEYIMNMYVSHVEFPCFNRAKPLWSNYKLTVSKISLIDNEFFFAYSKSIKAKGCCADIWNMSHSFVTSQNNRTHIRFVKLNHVIIFACGFFSAKLNWIFQQNSQTWKAAKILFNNCKTFDLIHPVYFTDNNISRLTSISFLIRKLSNFPCIFVTA